MMKAGAVALTVVLVSVFTVIILITGGGQSTCAVTSAVSADAAAQRAPVDGYAGDQLVNAAAIMNAGAALGVSTVGQTIGVMTAMGESSLKNITYGDAAGPDSRGLFQQRDTWGTFAQRMDPTQAATFFFERLVKVPNWDTMAPSAAAHAVQINADPDHYTKYYPSAKNVVTTLVGGGDAACAAGAVGADAQQLAEALVQKIDAGRIVGSSPDHMKEIRWIAAGEVHPDCGIDLRILQVITIAANTFDSIGISDINRACTGQRPGAGNASAHVVNGGGHAVDFYSFDRIPTTGADANAIKLLKILDPRMAAKSGFGQSECRAKAGSSIPLSTNDFPDTCTHVHVQVDPNGTEPMKLSS
jgi:hypothetical protein